VCFVRRGFHLPAEPTRRHLERVGSAFVYGYNCSLDIPDSDNLVQELAVLELEFRGFAYEGAGMGLAIMDMLFPRHGRGRVEEFMRGPAFSHVYMVLVGIGWATARLPLFLRCTFSRWSRVDGLLTWLILDGYGFHCGYFHGNDYLCSKPPPRRLIGYARRAFDQGLGRSLWFVQGGDIDRIAANVQALDARRHSDLWSGVGLASAYAGGVGAHVLERLVRQARDCAPELAQGAAFAAKARQRAGNMTPHTEAACQVLCRMPAAAAAQETDRALQRLPSDGQLPAYEVWRDRIRSTFRCLLPS
jgi:hypothetical protein